MEKRITFTLITLLAAATAANAGVVRVTGVNPYDVTVVEGSAGMYTTGQSFKSFCLEYSEFLAPGKYYESNLNTQAELGGLVWQDNNGNNADGNYGETRVASGGFDPLDPVTAYIYRAYVDGTFTNALEVQKAIHYAEAERSFISGTALDYFNQARNANPTDIGNVRVLNLWGYSGPLQPNGEGLPPSIRYRQDILVMIDGPALVPSPGALLLGSLGVGLVGYLRRRKTI